MPLFTASRGPLTSDESLYAAEALNMESGAGLTYTTGRPVSHRAPLYPALLAAAFKIGGRDLDTAAWVPRIATAANAVLVALLARRLAGPLAGLAAGVAAASSSYLNGLGTSLFLDQVEVTFVLLSLLALASAAGRGDARAYALGGAALGLAVLVKESALQLAPLPLALFLIAGAPPGWRACLVVWTAALVAVVGWWWVWVYAHEGIVFLLGDPAATTAQIAIVATLEAALALLVLLVLGKTWLASPAPPMQRLAGVALVLASGAVFVLGLEWQSWEHPRRYWSDVPAYVTGVLVPALPAAPLMAAALIWCLGRSWRGDRAAAVVALAALLYLPHVLVAANRDLSLRNAAPFLYIGLVALGCGVAWLLAWGSTLARAHGNAAFALAGAAVASVALVAIAAQGFGRIDRAAAGSFDADWDNVIAADTARWLAENVPSGTPVMSTRVYYSQVYFLTGGRYPVHQLPTVLVTAGLDREAPLSARGTLFRWERLEERERRTWLYLTRYTTKSYYFGLAEEDLIAEIRERRTGYVIVNARDVGFSSPAYLAYFDANPAFRRLYQRAYGDSDISVIYGVDLERLAPSASPALVTQAAYEGLLERAKGDAVRVREALGRLNPDGFEVVPW